MNESERALRKGAVLYGDSYKYRIEKVLGNGSFGITYMASVNIDGGIQAYVAVKEFFLNSYCYRDGSNVVYSGSDGKFDKYLRKFNKEIDHITRLNDDGIIKVIDSFEGNGTAYYVMEYVDGGSLDDHLRRNGPYDEQTAIRMAIRIGQSLAYLHSQGILHLDLKPQNIMLRNATEPVIIDFGLSKLYNEGSGLTSTLTHEATSGYAPVEQYNYSGNGFPVTMDVYALGGTLYKMLCGQVPPHATVVLNTDGIIASSLKGCGISALVIAVVEKAMQPLVKKRYQTVSEMLASLTMLYTNLQEQTDYEPNPQKKQTSVPPKEHIKQKTNPSKQEKNGGSPLGLSYTSWMWIGFTIIGLLFGFGPAKMLHKLLWP